jgi:hypothetical protein
MDGWVKIGSAPNESMAQMMEQLLRSAGIPVLVRRPASFDVPDFLAAGPRDVLVPGERHSEASEIVEDTMGFGSW